MEIRTRSTSEADALAERLTSLCEQQASPAAFRAVASEKLFFAFKDMQRFENLRVELDQCVEVRLRTEAAIVTLVGNDLANIDGIEARVFSALKKTPAVLVPSACSPHAISFIVGQADLRKSVELLHQEFFAVVDPLAFAESLPSVPPPATAIPKSRRNRERIAASPASQPNLAFLRR
jgi:aspartokinase